jgi:hypothetical protein
VAALVNSNGAIMINIENNYRISKLPTKDLKISNLGVIANFFIKFHIVAIIDILLPKLEDIKLHMAKLSCF